MWTTYLSLEAALLQEEGEFAAAAAVGFLLVLFMVSLAVFLRDVAGIRQGGQAGVGLSDSAVQRVCAADHCGTAGMVANPVFHRRG